MRYARLVRSDLIRIRRNAHSRPQTVFRRRRQISYAAIDAVPCGSGISVHDHIIVGKEGHASFKGQRLI